MEPGAYNADDLSLHPRFIEHGLPDTGLFKLLQSTTQIFYVKREDDEDTLRQRLEDGGLRGMSFIPVWSSGQGPAAVNLQEIV